jgi:hypothetical protein
MRAQSLFKIVLFWALYFDNKLSRTDHFKIITNLRLWAQFVRYEIRIFFTNEDQQN